MSRHLRRYAKPNGSIVVSNDGQLAFIPRDLPPPLVYDREMVMLLAEAERRVGELKGSGASLENPHVLLRQHHRREAVLSSKIEGTLASMRDLNMYDAVGNISERDAVALRIREVRNYVQALEQALEKMKRQDISVDILLRAHRTLMDGVREEEKRSGVVRKRQNWIAKTHGTKQTIVYTPPPHEEVRQLLCSLERFIQERHDDIPVLIQCAMAHYQFEAIHPFEDGNGRIGRLLLPLMLHKKGLLPEPLLYLSAFFEKHREQYYGGLLEVSRKSKWGAWVKFFLRAFATQAKDATDNIRRLVELRKAYKGILLDVNAGGRTIRLLDGLFVNPYITIPQAAKFLDVRYPTAKDAVLTLVDLGILVHTDIPFKSKIFWAKKIDETLMSEHDPAAR